MIHCLLIAKLTAVSLKTHLVRIILHSMKLNIEFFLKKNNIYNLFSFPSGGSYCDSSGLSAPSGLCPEGYFCPEPTIGSTDNICPIGNICPEGSPDPIPCPAG